MEEKKNFELADDQLESVAGGTGGGHWGDSPDYPNGCPKCGKDVYRIGKGIRVELDEGFGYTDDYVCESCDYYYSTDGRYPIGYC